MNEGRTTMGEAKRNRERLGPWYGRPVVPGHPDWKPPKPEERPIRNRDGLRGESVVRSAVDPAEPRTGPEERATTVGGPEDKTTPTAPEEEARRPTRERTIAIEGPRSIRPRRPPMLGMAMLSCRASI